MDLKKKKKTQNWNQTTKKIYHIWLFFGVQKIVSHFSETCSRLDKYHHTLYIKKKKLFSLCTLEATYPWEDCQFTKRNWRYHAFKIFLASEFARVKILPWIHPQFFINIQSLFNFIPFDSKTFWIISFKSCPNFPYLIDFFDIMQLCGRIKRFLDFSHFKF